MTNAIRYNDEFLSDMSPELAGEYRRWYPYCREAVLETIDLIGSRKYLEKALGEALPDTLYQMLRTAWFEPYRAYHLRSGKMLRPFIVCFCLQAYGRDPRQYPRMVALSEIIHAASLVLDDIADDSPLRRGGPTAHSIVGVRVAGASASAWLNACFELLGSEDTGLEDDALDLLLHEISWEHWVTGIGTTIDVSWPWLGRLDHTAGEYLQSVVHRSTSYTYRLPFKIGAIAAGANSLELKQFTELGEEFGLSFQIIDDILNVQPSSDNWGKQIAEDITQGKITLQVLLALERSEPAERQRLIEILRSRTTDIPLLKQAADIMDRSGAFDAARAIALEHVSRMKEIVEGMSFLAEIDRQRLQAFIAYVVKRSR